VSPKTSTFYFLNNSLKNLTDFNFFWQVKSGENLTPKSYRLSISHVRCSHCTLEKSKKSFSTVLFIHTSHYLHYLTRKQSVIHLPTPPENVTTLTCELQNLRFVAFFQTLEALKRSSCGLWSVALKRTGCDVWQLKCQASNVTASVQSDHLLH